MLKNLKNAYIEIARAIAAKFHELIEKIFSENICDCPIFTPYILGGECRFCFGIHKREFNKKYSYILHK